MLADRYILVVVVVVVKGRKLGKSGYLTESANIGWHHCKGIGHPALTTDTAADLEATQSDRLTKPGSGRFVAGDSRARELGRLGGSVKRGERYLDKLAKERDKHADGIAKAIIREAEKGNVRAHTFLRDTLDGVPATKLLIEQTDSPASELLLRMLAVKGISPQLPESSHDSHTHTIDRPALPPGPD